jgi:PBP1b-binding outer membrane lipoprotein LpoB
MKYLLSSRIVLLIIISIIIASCSKNEDGDPNKEEKMANLKVPTDFNWSLTDNVSIQATTDQSYNETSLIMYNLDGNIIDKQRVINNQAGFIV